ncbi:hypothetical protein K493DRAFT_297127 [Basidiobolus meristosporus CBS 931.73]|uniref:DNA mismatch repair protein S5 domain-containing protein n=1 Tax=Basidiobolus meristosporus CBS 931.73 TaxID=1314790 RepID=A0A1Y1Z1X8_9FUNG|nr:hypothetical protein K493DRAFT_297127 [Basidiobolus meristosporus CBS 931.73]|eukprot:ORY04176.1 hypothetical protein K493DRAFT_297127 [Basidiobolus meristosporus CBS 931.73]
MISKLDQQVVHQLRANLNINSVEQCLLELLQNSLDANANQIQITLDLERFYIRVEDNGAGIQPDDMKKLGQRYATSKCKSLEDLKAITTFGFRGEGKSSVHFYVWYNEVISRLALASISEFATIEISSLHKDYFDSYSCIIKISVIVRDSMQQRILTLEKVCISTNFGVISANYPSDQWPSVYDDSMATLEQRNINIYVGLEVFLISLRISTESPFEVLNKRVILANSLHSTINSLFASSNFGSQYPVYALQLHCSPSEYDICLDPTKSIVEFEIMIFMTNKDWDEIRSLFTELVTNFLKEYGLSRSKSTKESDVDGQNAIFQSRFFQKAEYKLIPRQDVQYHAADERIKLERLFQKVFTKISQTELIVETEILPFHIEIGLTPKEYDGLQEAQENFHRWGIKWKPVDEHDKIQPQTENTRAIFVSELPKCIANRCLNDFTTTRNMIKQHIHWLEENRWAVRLQPFSLSKAWAQNLTGCPQGFIEILNSQACRSSVLLH